MIFPKALQKIIILILAGVSTIFTSQAQREYRQNFDCFSIVVGKDATVDGSVIFGHNEDTGTRMVNFYKVPQGNHKAGESVYLENGGSLVRNKETLGYLWLNRPESDVCDSYLNEKGVAIGSDGCPSKEDKPELKSGGIVYWLRRLVAEEAHTAREGVELAGKLIDKYGYASSGRTYIIADSQEGWLLAVVNGKHWVAQRVPDDQVAVVANCYSIGEIDLSDTLNFLVSPDIIDYAVKRGWYNSDKDGKFNFAKAYSNPESLTHPRNVNRIWKAINLLSGKNYSLNEELPSMAKPEEKISIQDVMAVLRVHYDEKAIENGDICSIENAKDLIHASICIKNTQYSVINHLRSWLPKEIGAIMWMAFHRPDIHSYSPWFSSVNKVPEIFGYKKHSVAIEHQFQIAPKTYDRQNGHAFWSYVSLAERVDENYINKAPPVKKIWKIMENEMFDRHAEFENEILKIYPENPGKARKKMTKYCSKTILQQYKHLKKINF
jgi:dipeptidase